ncbi:MAG: tRNA (guanosine(46)-N7)-methyltransferase TrmB [Bacteroidales bacterium]|nr:tRNA (guanosine(46)-N7)-methyltransferase TrmB [Bacteroidales bacterium]
MPKRKLERFAENKTFPHFFQPHYDELLEGFPFRGKWNSMFFKNDFPIVLELGCGKGEFTVGLAQRFPEKNYIGMDVKGARMWRGAKTSHQSELKNVAFVRSKIQGINFLFDTEEVDEFWITFPDPHPNKPRTKKRLTSPDFLDRYRKIAKPGAVVHLKTDNAMLFDYTLDVIREQNLPLLFHTFDVDKNPGTELVLEIRTFYEEMFRNKGVPIKYLKFTLQ